MHSCDPAPPPPPATGARLLLELGHLIISSRQGSPQRAPTPAKSAPPPQTREEAYHPLLQAKLLAARNLTPNLPSTSKASQVLEQKGPKAKEDAAFPGSKSNRGASSSGGVPGLDAVAVGEAVSKAQRALLLDAQLNSHIQALWSDQVPVCIDILLAGECRQCGVSQGVGASGGNQLLLERWTLTLLLDKLNDPPTYITSQWLLNAVRSQLHFSQISAWHAKMKATSNKDHSQLDPQERQRKLSRETCNYKKLESNCDDEELRTGEEEDKEQRKLNIVYSLRIPVETYKTTEFTKPPNIHTFPFTDIGGDACLKVTLESLPRFDEIPIIKCSCIHSSPPKRRMSKEFIPVPKEFIPIPKEFIPTNLQEEITARMNDLTLGPPETNSTAFSDLGNIDFREKTTAFNDLELINSNIGSSSGITRKLSIFSTNPDNSYNNSRVSTPDRQNDSGYQESKSTPSWDMKKSIQLDHPYFNQSLSIKENVLRANYLLVDDRMHTPCSESGKHRCSCDDESDQGKEYPRSSIKRPDDGEVRLRAEAKYRRRQRKETKLKEMRESESGTSECKEKEEISQTTSIPILQASRFDRMKTIGCYRNQTYLTLPAYRRGFKDAASETLDPTIETIMEKSVNSIGTQTDLTCECGSLLQFRCEPCERRKMVRSEASYDLARVNQSEILLEAMERTCQAHPSVATKKDARKKEQDETDNEKVMKKHKCDSNDNIKCDLSLSDSLSCGVRKCPDDDVNQNIIKRPKLKRFFPIVDRIGKVISERKQIDESTSQDIDDLLLKDDDSVFAYMAKSHSTPKGAESVPRSSMSEDEYVLYEKCDYGTFDGFDSTEHLVPDGRSDLELDADDRHGSWRRNDLCSSRRVTSDLNMGKYGSNMVKYGSNSDLTSQRRSNIESKNGSNSNIYGSQRNIAKYGSNKDIYGSQNSVSISDKSSFNSELSRSDNNLDQNQNESGSTHISNKPSERSGDIYGSSDTKFDERGKGSMEHLAIPSSSEMEGFRWRFDSAASMVFHTRTGLPLTSSPAPLRKGKSCFDYDSSITGISGIKSALFHPVSPPEGWWSPGSSPGSPVPLAVTPKSPPLTVAPPVLPTPLRNTRTAESRKRLKVGSSTGLLGSFEESALNGRLEPVATVHGFTAEIGASGAFCPPHRRLPVTVFFYALGGTAAPYLGHINLGPSGYRVPRSGTVQVSLFNPHGTLVKMFVVLYDLTDMPPSAKTFLRQRTLYMPCDATAALPPRHCCSWLRYLIHLRFLTSKSGKLYLHTDIRIIVSRKADVDTATAHSPIYSTSKPPNNQGQAHNSTTVHAAVQNSTTNQMHERREINNKAALNGHVKENGIGSTNQTPGSNGAHQNGVISTNGEARSVNRVFGGCDQDVEEKKYDYESAKSDHEFLIGRKMNRSEACLELSTHCDRKKNSNEKANDTSLMKDPFYKKNESFQKNNSMNQNDSFNQKNESLNQKNNSLNQKNDSLNQKNDSLNQKNDSLNQKNDSLNQKTDSFTQKDDSCEQNDDSINPKNDQINVVNSHNVSYELRSFTYAPDNPKYSPR